MTHAEHEHSINGVSGRMFARHKMANGLYASQTWKASRPIDGWGEGAFIVVEMRFDDNCKNGHQTYAITADIRRPKARDIVAGGWIDVYIVVYLNFVG